VLAEGLGSWKLLGLYFPSPVRQQEFGLVLERTSTTGREASIQFVRDWTTSILRMGSPHANRVAAFACALHRDLPADQRADAAAALAEAAAAAAPRPPQANVRSYNPGHSVDAHDQRPV
jgi:hypothetical protein